MNGARDLNYMIRYLKVLALLAINAIKLAV